MKTYRGAAEETSSRVLSLSTVPSKLYLSFLLRSNSCPDKACNDKLAQSGNIGPKVNYQRDK